MQISPYLCFLFRRFFDVVNVCDSPVPVGSVELVGLIDEPALVASAVEVDADAATTLPLAVSP